MKFATVCLVFILITVAAVYGYAGYQEKIPNGDHVPHSCKANFMWKGVGHLQRSGGGERNQFGKDFMAADKTWTVELCQGDSDGDGVTNGQELGDPNCTWTPGTIPHHVTGITHPGICDPWGSAQCNDRNSWVNCDSDEFDCPAIKEEGVKQQTLVIPLTNIPNKPTNYYCMTFDLPSDGDYHMIATTPIINETRVMHHLGLLACADDSAILDKPTECAMGVKGCSNLIGLWTLGLPGECVYKEAGFRLGQMGFKRGLLQFHWTNPEKRSDLWDASGMTIYYTNKLRKYDAGTWMTGQEYLEIPPLTKNVVQQSTCSSRCTKKIFNGTVHLMTGLNHMHYLGVSGRVKLTREDGSTQMLTDEPVYSYDTPILNRYEPPVELQGGDSIETVCSYRSLSRKETAVYGRGTYDEMCYGIFTYYPAESITNINCVTRKEFELCDYRENGCDFEALQNFTNPETRQLINRVFATCTHAGGCLHGCRDLVKDIMTNHVCFKDGMAEAVTYRKLMERGTDKLEALKWVAALKSCECTKENPINYVENNEPGHIDNTVPSSNTSQITAYTVVVLILSALRLF